MVLELPIRGNARRGERARSDVDASLAEVAQAVDSWMCMAWANFQGIAALPPEFEHLSCVAADFCLAGSATVSFAVLDLPMVPER